VSKIVTEIASGVNDSRPKLLALFEDQAITLIVVEQKDQLTRFGFRYLATLLKSQGWAIEGVNQAENDQEDLLADLRAILYSFTARLYGQRRAQRKTAPVMRALEAGESEGEHAAG
jgi:putative resolvase